MKHRPKLIIQISFLIEQTSSPAFNTSGRASLPFQPLTALYTPNGPFPALPAFPAGERTPPPPRRRRELIHPPHAFRSYQAWPGRFGAGGRERGPQGPFCTEGARNRRLWGYASRPGRLAIEKIPPRQPRYACRRELVRAGLRLSCFEPGKRRPCSSPIVTPETPVLSWTQSN